MYVIAYDIGTTGVKTCLFEVGDTLRLLAGEYEGYGLYILPGGGAEQDAEIIVHEPFTLNIRNRTLEKDGRRIKLTQVEYAIIQLFMQNPGRALSREDILTSVWGRDYDGDLKIVDVNIRRLRIKIEDNTANPTYITTVWGFGYKWGV